jgi:ribonuclease BN (tRNA processing enzyme)
VAKAADVKRLVLTHIDPLITDDDPVRLAKSRHLFPKTETARDLLEVEF